MTQLLDEGSIFQYCPAGMDGGRAAVVAKQTQPTWSIALPSRWRNTFKNDLFNIEHKNHDIFCQSPSAKECASASLLKSNSKLCYVFVNEVDDATIEGCVTLKHSSY